MGKATCQSFLKVTGGGMRKRRHGTEDRRRKRREERLQGRTDTGKRGRGRETDERAMEEGKVDL